YGDAYELAASLEIGLAPIKLATVLIVGVLVYRVILNRERPPRGFGQAVFMLAAYGVIGAAGLLHAVDDSSAIRDLSEYLKSMIMVGLLLWLVRGPDDLRAVLRCLILVGLALGLFSVHQYLVAGGTSALSDLAPDYPQEGIDALRIVGPFDDPNVFARVMLPLLPLAWAGLRDRGSALGWRILAAAALLGTAFSVLATYSRGAFIGLVAMLAVMLVRGRRHPGAIALTALVLAGALVAVP